EPVVAFWADERAGHAHRLEAGQRHHPVHRTGVELKPDRAAGLLAEVSLPDEAGRRGGVVLGKRHLDAVGLPDALAELLHHLLHQEHASSPGTKPVSCATPAASGRAPLDRRLGPRCGSSGASTGHRFLLGRSVGWPDGGRNRGTDYGRTWLRTLENPEKA